MTGTRQLIGPIHRLLALLWQILNLGRPVPTNSTEKKPLLRTITGSGITLRRPHPRPRPRPRRSSATYEVYPPPAGPLELVHLSQAGLDLPLPDRPVISPRLFVIRPMGSLQSFLAHPVISQIHPGRIASLAVPGAPMLVPGSPSSPANYMLTLGSIEKGVSRASIRLISSKQARPLWYGVFHTPAFSSSANPPSAWRPANHSPPVWSTNARCT